MHSLEEEPLETKGLAVLAMEAHKAQEETFEEGPALDDPEYMPELSGEGDSAYLDDVSGEVLPAGLTHDARVEELKFMKSWHVWDVRPVAECWARTGKAPVGGRWVDHNKGDARHSPSGRGPEEGPA